MIVGISGSHKYGSTKKIKDFIYKTIQKYGADTKFLTMGSSGDVEWSVHKYASDFGAYPFDMLSEKSHKIFLDSSGFSRLAYIKTKSIKSYNALCLNIFLEMVDILFVFVDPFEANDPKWEKYQKMAKKHKKKIVFLI